MASTPSVIVFDVNETLSDMSPLSARFVEVGAPAYLARGIADGILDLKKAGLRLVTFSNGSAQVAESLLTRAGLRDEFEALLTVDDAPAWKPVRSAYEYAADACVVQPSDLLLVAVHPWDIHGAAQAGLRTAWLNRTGETYPGFFAAPDHTITTLGELAPRLAPDPDPINHRTDSA